jgi:hypothetical protein
MQTQLQATIAKIERLLTNPGIQARTPLATKARKALIAQLFWADRVLTAVIDGVDYTPYSAEMIRWVDDADLSRFIDMVKNKGCAGK